MLEQAAERLYVATFDSSAPADDAGLRASTAAVRGLSLKQARGVVG
jgi:hypothetical protein